MSTHVIHPGKGDTEFARPCQEEDFDVVLTTASDFSESFTFIVFGKEGDILQIGIIIANIPTKTQEPGLNLKYFDPSGKMTHFTQKYNRKDIEVFDDNKSLAIGQNKMIYNKENNTYHVELGDKYNKEIVVQMDFTPPEGEKGFENGSIKFSEDGNMYFGEDKKNYVSVFYTQPCGRAKGRAVVNGKEIVFEDSMTFLSTFRQNFQAHKWCRRWHLLKFHDFEKNSCVNCNYLICPTNWDRHGISHSSLILNGKLVGAAVDTELQIYDEILDPDSKYKWPAHYKYIINGYMLEDSRPYKVEIELKSTNLYHKMDILGYLPWVIRMIIKAFIARPFLFQWFDEATASITIGDDDPIILNGKCLHECTFVNP